MTAHFGPTHSCFQFHSLLFILPTQLSFPLYPSRLRNLVVATQNVGAWLLFFPTPYFLSPILIPTYQPTSNVAAVARSPFGWHEVKSARQGLSVDSLLCASLLCVFAPCVSTSFAPRSSLACFLTLSVYVPLYCYQMCACQPSGRPAPIGTERIRNSSHCERNIATASRGWLPGLPVGRTHEHSDRRAMGAVCWLVTHAHTHTTAFSHTQIQ